jgi:DNA-binding transcriptional MocR family regulator
MRHAGAEALDRLDGLLQQVRRRHPELKERKRGAFYRGGQGWLHFHEDPAGLFADLKVDGEWARFAVDTAAERKVLLERLGETLAPLATA